MLCPLHATQGLQVYNTVDLQAAFKAYRCILLHTMSE